MRIIGRFSIPHPEIPGGNLADILHEWDVDQKEAARRLHPAGAVYFQLHEDDVQGVLAYPYIMIFGRGHIYAL